MLKQLLPHGAVEWYRVQRDRRAFHSQFELRSALLGDSRFVCRWEDRWPCLYDATSTTGFDAHYLYHPAWAVRRIVATKPKRHVDIGSKLDFVALLSAFMPVDFYDYRPANITLSNLLCGHADITALQLKDASVMSLSCMHVLEHIGLERYGDPFDPQGDLKAMCELTRILAPGGNLYVVVPTGREARIQYNAHRIYTYQQVIEYFPLLNLKSFAFVADSGTFYDSASEADTKSSVYGCGCFEFTKLL